jgi:predicted phage tail component-like protein
MTQPSFLRNFTIDGVDIGELFLVGTVTMPFMNIERGYYQVGNTNGQHLLYSRLGSNSITVNGTLITDHTNLSVSETKDLLVSQLMSNETMKLIFDGQPDRYYNVVYEGLQEYDATNLDFTPLTLEFTVPDGVAHSIASDPFRNTASTSVNMVVDSNFETATYWSKEAYVEQTQRNGANVLAIDNSEQDALEMANTYVDYVADGVFYDDASIKQGATFNFGVDYGIVKKSSLDTDGTGTLEFTVEELDEINGKVLDTKKYPMTLPTGTNPLSTAYSFSSNGLDRWSTNNDTQPNLYPVATSESPITQNYQSSVVTTTLNQTVPEWGATTAVRTVITGGTNAIKGRIPTGLRTVGGVTYTSSIYAKNNGTSPITLNSNFAGTTILQAGESRRVFHTASRPIGAVDADIQWLIQVADASQSVDVTLWRAKTSANTQLDVWTEANQVGVDNTSFPYVGYSTTDNAAYPSNLLLNGALKGTTAYWALSTGMTASSTLDYTTLTKSAVTSGGVSLYSNGYSLNGAVIPNTQYSISGEFYIPSPQTTSFSNTELRLRITYSDNSVQDIVKTFGSLALDTWHTISVTGNSANKTILSVSVQLSVAGTFVGNMWVRNIKLEEGSVSTPFTRHVTERGQYYTWSTNGTGFNLSSVPLTRFNQLITISNEKTKVLRLSLNAYGDSYTIINRPMLRVGNNTTFVASAKTYLSAIEVQNLGTSTAYPMIEINNQYESGSIGLVNDEGGVLQFGNIGDVDTNPPKENQSGYFYNWNVTSKPASVVVNSGHVSNYPTIYDDVDKPNLYLGNFNYSVGDIVKPAFASTFAEGAWSGPSMSTPVASPTGGNKTGAFEQYELLTFKSADNARGRYEISVITNANDILMSCTLRDSSTTNNELLFECWLGNRLLKTISVDIKKTQGHWYAVRMIRDSTGKKFTWRIDNIVIENVNGRIQHVSKLRAEHTYNSPTMIKSVVDRVSRWLLKYDDGKGEVKTLKGIDIQKRTKNVLNIRSATRANSRSQGTVAAGLTFKTTVPQKGQSIYGNNEWYYITKGAGIPASGWVSGYYLSEVSRTNVYDTRLVDTYTVMQINDSIFTWLGNDNQTDTTNPFRAGDQITIDTFEKRIYVNGSEREDLAVLGNQWERFAIEPGTHFIKVVDVNYQLNTMEVTVRVQRRYH